MNTRRDFEEGCNGAASEEIPDFSLEKGPVRKEGAELRSDDRSAPEATVRRSVLEAVTYYDCFEFPLTFDELTTLVGMPIERDQLVLAVQELVQASCLVETISGDQLFYSLCQRPTAGTSTTSPIPPTSSTFASSEARRLVDRRQEGQVAAANLWPKVALRCGLIARFPFVRAIAVSGSLSKGVHFSGDDVDFFLIAAPGRVWTCRLLLMLFKRAALFGSRRLFCINYLVDETAFLIPDRNRFTAAEIAWLVPMVGHQEVAEFSRANGWIEEFMPSWSQGFADRPSRPCRDLEGIRRNVQDSKDGHHGNYQRGKWCKRILEWLLAGQVGDAIERTSRRLIKRRNARRYAADLSKEHFAQAMRGEAAVSKHHPNNQQSTILDRFERRWMQVERACAAELARVSDGLESERS